jgi:hypothetical protein
MYTVPSKQADAALRIPKVSRMLQRAFTGKTTRERSVRLLRILAKAEKDRRTA